MERDHLFLKDNEKFAYEPYFSLSKNALCLGEELRYFRKLI